MEKNNIEQLCYQHIQQVIPADQSHDIHHILRVVKMAKKLSIQEQANIDVVIPAAWLHDCVPIAKNSPLRAQSSQLAATQAKIFLTQHQYKPDLLNEIAHAIEAHSYSANIIPRTLEAKIVQDADRLDALGAIGLTRAIMVSNQLDLEFYHTQDPFCKKREPNDHQYGLDHFYTKLLTLAEKFHTHAGKVEAQRRIEFLHQYLNQLSSEI